MERSPTSEPLNTRVVDDDLTYVLATSKGRAAGLFAQLVGKGKTFTVVPVNEAYCEFWISEQNETKTRWWRE